MTARAIFAPRRRGGGRAWAGLALMAVLAALWLAAASRVHVNASWSDDAWGYLVLPVGNPAIGDTVLFEPRPEPGPGQAASAGWPGAVPDNGRAARLGLAGSPVPALVLFDTATKRAMPVGFGVLAEDQIAERIFVLTRLETGHDY